MDKIVEMHPELYNLAKKSKETRGITYSIEGTTINIIVCDLENQALMTAFDYLIQQDIEVDSLVFDGLMIYKDRVSPTRLEEVLMGVEQAC